ncbi:2-hydroxyacid dehydrogenase [Herbaspirillum sp. LeCh32-8]|uniref:2-hydroxyacid dehydrogenase n=1 Tax=Herbaspirillum sp. LeCh32-8 TaxID=2821356 RepID=UPI001AE58FE2|nr:2-hydroxyacid dehydrogenase [Herbaspirillum sp. LeCh32-8]MBP0599452.1 2-hydroxyacid dehydrogenase [Herbaspirillum sp. LeCh32-8]
MKPPLLVLIHLSETSQAIIGAHYDILYAPDRQRRAEMIAGPAKKVAVVLTNGATGLTADEMRALSHLQLVCALGAGYENVDRAHAEAAGIEIATGAGTNEDCVADHAMGLLLATVRHIAALDKITRDGGWRENLPLQPQLAGKRLGIVGLGGIGKKIARRAAGFDIEIAYCNRKKRDDVDYHYFPDVAQMAAWSDFLIVAAPGGAETKHLISERVINELGPKGYLVNIGRGSIVDTAALGRALAEGRLGGAGLDVYESEPKPPQELIGLSNVVLTPHVAGWSPESIDASVRQFLRNCEEHFAAAEPVVRA